MNSMFNGNNLQKGNSPNNPLNMLMAMIQSGGNPQQIVQSMVQQNPQLQQVFNEQMKSGMNIKDFTLMLAKQKGVDITPLISMIKK